MGKACSCIWSIKSRIFVLQVTLESIRLHHTTETTWLKQLQVQIYYSFRVRLTGESMFKEIKHNQPCSSQSIKVQRASRDTCLLAKFICIHLLYSNYLVLNWIIASRLMHVRLPDKLSVSASIINCERGLMDNNCVLEFF